MKNKLQNFCNITVRGLEARYKNYHMSERICNILKHIASNGTYEGSKVNSLFIQINYYDYIGYPSWWNADFDTAIKLVHLCVDNFPDRDDILPF